MLNTTHLDFRDYFNMDVNVDNSSVPKDDVTPASEQSFVVIVYSCLLATGAFGNVAVFTSLVRSRRRKSRVNLLMTHLTVADMIVIFFVIPLEIGWKTTNAWLAGNFACKLFLVLRAFGLYLSSNVLVCISLDRFYAVLYPLRLPIARKRSKVMLYVAWIIALLCSLPQSVVFRVMTHPRIPDFQQCVSFGAFSNQHEELAYNVFCLCAMYFFPLMIITVCYACIFYEISKNSKEITDKCHQSDHTKIQLRRSDRRPLARARRRTLRMTVTIVTVFACCWLPYATMTLWYMLDRPSAEDFSSRLQDFFFIMAVSNACMDPLVYGSYTLDVRRFIRALKKMFCIHSETLEMNGTSGPGTIKTKMQTNDIVHPENVIPRKREVRFYETSLMAPSCCSDPTPGWSEHSSEHKVKSAKSCEVFTVHTN